MIRVAINGFGRIGRITLRELLERKELEVVAINDLGEPATLAHLFKYDSVHGIYPHEVRSEGTDLVVRNQRIPVYSEADPANLPWSQHNVDVVIESTGRFRTLEDAHAHLQAGAHRVIISAPPKGDGVKSVVLGINEHVLDGTERVISNASCTTNSAAPLVHVMKDLVSIEAAYITTVHSYTSDQRLHDAPHSDLRRARAAAQSIVPTTTGAAKAITKIFPELNGKIGGAGIRVPVPDGSLTDMTFVVQDGHGLTVETINAAYREASEGALKGILQYTEDPIVSVDIVGNKHSGIFDALLTSVIGNMIKVVGWYDNEMGYSTRLADLVLRWKPE